MHDPPVPVRSMAHINDRTDNVPTSLATITEPFQNKIDQISTGYIIKRGLLE